MAIRPARSLFYSATLITMVLVAPVRAQSRLSIAGDIGVTNAAGRGGEYYNRNLQGVRLAASARFGIERVGMFAEVSRESLGSLIDGDGLVCPLAQSGGCVPEYPKMHGWSTSVGVLLRPRHFLEGKLGIGPGWYFTRDQANPRLTAIVCLADIAVYPIPHVGVTLSAEEVALGRYRGDRLSVRPITIGLRVR